MPNRTLEVALRDQTALTERVMNMSERERALRRTVLTWRIACAGLAAASFVLAWRMFA